MAAGAPPQPSAVYRYPLRALASDYLESGAGLLCTAMPLVLVQPAASAAWVLGAAALLFLVYFGRTVCRQMTRIELDEAGIRAAGPLGATIRWEELRALGLHYYSTRRDGEEGWMQLRLRDARRTIRIDSAIERFAELAAHAARQAAQRNLALDATTLANLRMLQPE
jgi:hypothetical protein